VGRVAHYTARIRIPELAAFLHHAAKMIRAFVLLVVAALATGCSDSSSSTAPTLPAAGTQVTENFSGTVQVGATDMHPFTVTTGNLTVAVTLTAAGPPTTIFMGLGVGAPAADGTCSLFSTAAVVVQAGTAPQLSGTVAAGTYCVAVFDVGNQNGPADYTVTVSHY